MTTRNWQDAHLKGQGLSPQIITQLTGIETDIASLLAFANGGSIPLVTSSVTRDSQNRITGFVNSTGTYTVGYDASTGLVSTISNGTTTRTISRDTSGLVTGVA